VSPTRVTGCSGFKNRASRSGSLERCRVEVLRAPANLASWSMYILTGYFFFLIYLELSTRKWLSDIQRGRRYLIMYCSRQETLLKRDMTPIKVINSQQRHLGIHITYRTQPHSINSKHHPSLPKTASEHNHSKNSTSHTSQHPKLRKTTPNPPPQHHPSKEKPKPPKNHNKHQQCSSPPATPA
jgi:hypothetical protein